MSSQSIRRFPTPRNGEGLEVTEAARLGERGLLDRLADAQTEREQAEAEYIAAQLSVANDRLREELWQRLQVRVSRQQVSNEGLRATVVVEGLRFSVFVEENGTAHLQVQLPCPRCHGGFWSVPVRDLKGLAALLASPRFFVHDCQEEGTW